MADNIFYILISAIIPFIGLLINFISYVIFLRSKIRMLVSVLLGFFCGIFSMLAVYLLLTDQITSELIFLQSAIYILFSYCMFHFNNLAITARRIRIIREIYSKGNSISTSELLSIYNSKIMVDLRLDRLVNTGQILLQNGRLFINSKILLAATMILVSLKWIFYKKIFLDIDEIK